MTRLIEKRLPLAEVSAESAREKSIRHGHISTLHIWWARRPLAASRAAVFGTLVPDSDENYELVKHIVPWEAVKDGNSAAILKARQKVLAEGGTPPKVLDPFAGGGAIPLEALRLGCETYALDLNPVAHIIQRATLEYPQKYGQPTSSPVPDYLRAKDVPKSKNHQANAFTDEGERAGAYQRNPLAALVRYWGEWVLEKARAELAAFYPAEPPETTKGATWQTSAELWSKLKPLAREMRKHATDAEAALWQLLRNKQLGVKFRRQHAIDRFIVDFYCPERKLVIEVDGGGHAEPAQKARDHERDEVLEQRGLRVLRFWNHEVLRETESVLEEVYRAVHAPSPSTPPVSPPQAGGRKGGYRKRGRQEG
jgi:very-short-patch-repair endonuclease